MAVELEFETERLRLRPLATSDLETHQSMMGDARVARFLSPTGEPMDRPAAWRGFATLLGHWTIRGFGFFSVFEKSSGAVVGRVGPWQPEGWPQIECGWGIHPDHWGKGYAPEAAVAAIRWTFAARPELTRIISLIDPANANSEAVARKVGETVTNEVFVLGDFRLRIWAASRAEWLARFG